MTAPPAWALALLRDARVARLGTADARGRPLVVPVCYVWDGRCVYSAVDDKPKRTRALRRLRNIAENPWVSLVVDEYHEDWRELRWVIVEGRATVSSAGEEVARAAALLRAKYPQYRTPPLDPGMGPVIRIDPERVLAWRAT